MSAIAFDFQRYEKKYLLTREQYRFIRTALQEQMQPDVHPFYQICNIYYDTPQFDLIRASLEHPVYKEKLRMRSYGVIQDGSPVFVELKKKYDGKVYKQRGIFSVEQATTCLAQGSFPMDNSQVCREISWFLRRYSIIPQVFIGYTREAYSGIAEPGLRVTFDTELHWRTDRLDLRCPDTGHSLLSDDTVLFEVKTPGAIPLWLSRLLNQTAVRPSSFSKYGTFYQNQLKEAQHV